MRESSSGRRVCFFVSALAPLAALALFGASALSASTFVRVPDPALVDQAAVIALVTVAAVEPPGLDSPEIVTTYRLDVERSLKGGFVAEIALHVPGGVRPDGVRGVLFGAPALHEGERLLVFLVPQGDGAYRLLHLMMGAFHVEATREGGSVALRSLAGATELPRLGEKALPREDPPRDLGRFTAWIADRLAGREREEDYATALSSSELSSLREKFTLLQDAGRNERWFEFDSGGSVPFYAHESGQPGVSGGGFAQIQAALAAWDGDPGSTIRLAYAGTTAVQGRLAGPNGLDEVTFDDPFDEISKFDCANGGILAETSTFDDYSSPRAFKGTSYVPITNSHVVTAKNIACSFNKAADPLAAFAAMLTHELGHSLGLSHSCGDPISPPCDSDPQLADAIMNARVHYDGRGAKLSADDQNAIRLLYSDQRERTGCVADAKTLCLAKGRFALTVDWANQFDGSTGAGRPVKGTDQAGYFSFGDPANVELLIKVLDFPTVTKVFYGELTNLHFRLFVTDTALHTSRTYTNSAGDCGGVDNEAFTVLPAGQKAAPAPTAGACRPSAATLCLAGNRFAVTIDWANPGNGASGTGQAHHLSDLVGTFSFTDPTNTELMVKLIQGASGVQFFWGALSDLPYTIHVTDTATGARKTYQSSAGKLCGGLDVHSF